MVFQGSYGLESQREKYQYLGRSGNVMEFFSRKLKGQGKVREKFLTYSVKSFQELYFFKCVNLGHESVNVFPHPAYNLCSVSCEMVVFIFIFIRQLVLFMLCLTTN